MSATNAEYRAAMDDIVATDAVMERYAVAGDLPPGKWTAAFIGRPFAYRRGQVRALWRIEGGLRQPAMRVTPTG